MENKEILEIYLRKLIAFCEAYDAFSIPAAMMAGGTEIKLQDVYTYIELVDRESFEEKVSDFSKNDLFRKDFSFDDDARNPARSGDYGELPVDIDGLIAKIDARIAELEAEEKLSDSSTGKKIEPKEKVETEDSASDKKLISRIETSIADWEGNAQEKANIRVDSYDFDLNGKIDQLDLSFEQVSKSTEWETNQENTAFIKGSEPVSEDIEKKELNYKWFLSAPGGGKTTLLKMYCLAYAYRYYEELFGKNEQVFPDWRTLEDICNKLGVANGEGACPFFISVRELQEADYPQIAIGNGFERILSDTIEFLLENDKAYTDCYKFLNQADKKIYIVDSVEEFSSKHFRKEFLEGLYHFSNGNKCYLSSRYLEYMENVRETWLDITQSELTSKEYVIDELKKETVRKFAEKWYAALNKVSGKKKLDVDRDFLIPLSKNPNVGNLISNPLELTSLLMISSYDSYLPSDYAKIYGRSIELWLTWTNFARYNYEDIMRQLSQVAYKMAISEHEKIVVKPDTLIEYIRDARKDLKRYYQQEWKDDKESISEFIQFLCRSHLISKSTDGYDFVHRQYQAYLVAYCISTNNFSRETRKKKSRFSYIEEHIREKDYFWNQIYKMISIIDIDLRDDIITTLFELSDGKSDSINDNNYYVLRLIELAIIPGVNFDEYEKRKLIELIIQDEHRWRIFYSKKVDLNEFLSINDKDCNEFLIKTAIQKNEELTENKKDEFRDAIATTLFYCIWNCIVGEQYVKEVLVVFFSNFINTSIMEMIYNSKEMTDQQILVKNTACVMGKAIIESNGYSDYYILIAAILGYEGDPYCCIDRLIAEDEFESDVIAVNMLVIASWLLCCKKASKLGYEVAPSTMSKYADFILGGILHGGIIQRDYMLAFSYVFAIGTTAHNEKTWFHEDILISVLQTAISEYEKEGTFLDEKDGSFSRSFEHISLYPCTYSEVCKEILEKNNVNLQEVIRRDLQGLYQNCNDIMSKIRSLKLIILLSDLEYDERHMMLREIKTLLKEPLVKRRLRDEDLELTTSEMIRQIEEYFPEKQKILIDLNFDDFSVDHSLIDDSEESEHHDFYTEERDISEYHDFYSEGRFEEAKQQYLNSFELLSSRNNLAYMLRRNEITEVLYAGVSYSVDMLLQKGIQEKEPYSIINYALFISYEAGSYQYEKGLSFLQKYEDSVDFLEASIWWYKLKNNKELEGYVVSMWLCDLGIFETKEELQGQSELLFPGKII
ncbi:hypothetical protein H6A03_07295 [[Clostridium] spiroforme]|nr:hypothetical protein [Thomasclavelia spiroformis]MBM6879545.1 hypothetical protein [Thomasclavelia spiroformis]